MITADKARELLASAQNLPLLLAAPDLAHTVIAQAEQIAAVWALYDRRCAETMDEVSDAEELFLADLSEALGGDR